MQSGYPLENDNDEHDLNLVNLVREAAKLANQVLIDAAIELRDGGHSQSAIIEFLLAGESTIHNTALQIKQSKSGELPEIQQNSLSDDQLPDIPPKDLRGEEGSSNVTTPEGSPAEGSPIKNYLGLSPTIGRRNMFTNQGPDVQVQSGQQLNTPTINFSGK